MKLEINKYNMESKHYRIQYLRRGEKTIHTDKNDEVMKFETVYDAQRYMNKARDNEPNNPVTFMNRVDICEFDGDKFVQVVQRY